MLLSLLAAITLQQGITVQAGFYRLSDLAKTVAFQVRLTYPYRYANLPIFVSAKGEEERSFVKNVGNAFHCRGIEEGSHAFNLVPQPEPVPEIVLEKAGHEIQEAVNVDKVHGDLKALSGMVDRDEAYQLPWHEAVARIWGWSNKTYPLKLRIDHLTDGGNVFFSDKPNASELPLPAGIAAECRRALVQRCSHLRQVEALASAYPNLSGKVNPPLGDLDPQVAPMVVSFNGTFKVGLCSQDGEAVVSVPFDPNYLPLRDTANLNLPKTKLKENPLFAALVRRYDALQGAGFAGQLPDSTTVLTAQQRNSIEISEPLELTLGPALRAWAVSAGKDLFIRLPDSYVFGRTRLGSRTTNAMEWLDKEFKFDPTVSLKVDGTTITVSPNGSPELTNEDREKLKAEVEAWKSSSTRSELLQRANHLESSWRSSVESVLVPVVTDHWDEWFVENCSSIRLEAFAELRPNPTASLSFSEEQALFDMCRQDSYLAVRFGSSVKDSKFVSSVVLSRVFDRFDQQAASVVTQQSRLVIRPPLQCFFGGVGMADSGEADNAVDFAALRAWQGAKWSSWPKADRLGKLTQEDRRTTSIGRLRSIGIQTTVDWPNEAKSFDIVTLEGLPDDIRAKIDDAGPVQTTSGGKP